MNVFSNYENVYGRSGLLVSPTIRDNDKLPAETN